MSGVISLVLESEGLIEMAYGNIFLYYDCYGSMGANGLKHGNKNKLGSD